MLPRVILIFAFPVVVGLAGCGGEPAPPPDLSWFTGVYVWQRQWSPPVAAGVAKVHDAADTFMVLGAEYEMRGSTWDCTVPNVDWTAIADAGKPTEIVIRAHVLPGIEGEPSTLIAQLAETSRSLLDRAHAAGIDVAGMQLDYDCATSKLTAYARLLRHLRVAVPDVPWSITTLPTWLGAPGFEEVVGAVDSFVLQVHGVDLPKSIDDPVAICDPARIPGWVSQASRLGKPFYVALPTYGYRLVFDKDTGGFRGLRGEGREEAYANAETREIMADPAAMAKTAEDLRKNPAPWLKGITWFRLPVEGDALNWTWPVFEGVLAGRAPETDIVAEAQSPEPGLYEIHIVNRGDHKPMEPVRVAVDWNYTGMMALDTMNKFAFTPKANGQGGTLTGPAPAPGEDVVAAWFRFAEVEKDVTFQIGEVANDAVFR